MKQTLLNQKNQQMIKAKISFILLMFTMMMTQLSAQVDCNSIMACNDNLQVSLDDNCKAEILPDFILEAQTYDDSFYTVELTDPFGNIIPNATLTSSNIGQLISVVVSLNGCSLSCWGEFMVEDKLPPVIVSCTEVILECSDDPNLAPVQPIAYDSCSALMYGYSDTETNVGCDTDYSKVITRSWVVVDASGNSSQCDQLIYIKQGKLDSIIWPANRDNIDSSAYSCEDVIPLLSSGAPDPSATGFPSNIECGNIQFYYEDLIFPICGVGTKTLRRWTVINWCTGQDTVHNQIIKIMDNVSPICIAPPEVIIPTDEGMCTGTYVVPPLLTVIECSDWDYEISYKIRDESGTPLVNAITTNVVKVNDSSNPKGYYYKITDLPQDSTWIIYTVTDACGNVCQAFNEVYIEDVEKPSVACEGYTVISLDDQGWADLFAESLDDHSWDNCGIDSFQVRRYNTYCDNMSEDLIFGKSVNFCCDDVGAGYIKVVLRVYDIHGNFNDCLVNVTVQDKFKPTISCPDDIHISCTQDYKDLSITGGMAQAHGNCSNIDVVPSDKPYLNDCGIGYVVRTWTATDAQGVSVTCSHTIYVDNLDPLVPGNIDFPGDIEIIGCSGGSNLHPDSLESKPTINNEGCNNLAIGYNDQYFYNVPGFCVKIIRTWSIMDWCSSTSGTGSIVAEEDQIIKIVSTEVPVFSDCTDINVDAVSGTCRKEVTVVSNATDDCTDAINLIYTWSVDMDANGSIDFTGSGNDFIRTFDVGSHLVRFTAKDECNNIGVCELYVNVGDKKSPTPYCIQEVVWAIDENGEAVVWASDFDLKSEDTCPPNGDLTFSFTPPSEGINGSLTFTCDDIENGIAELIPLNMYVIDESGNYSYCSVVLNLQDNQDACIDQAGVVASISGKVMFTNNVGIDNLDVRLYNITDQEGMEEKSSNSGDFMFEDLGFYDTYAVSAQDEKSAIEGVSTLDLLLIQRHILKLKKFEDPYKVIAADINNSGSVSAVDLIVLRKLLLGKVSEFPDNTSWKYINPNTEFEDDLQPWEYEESINIASLYNSQENADLYAIKIGDVNETVISNYSNGESDDRSVAVMHINTMDQSFDKEQTVNVGLLMNDMIGLEGMQFTIEFDPTVMSFIDVHSNLIKISKENISMELVERGKILLSWNGNSTIVLTKGEELLNLNFKSLTSGSLNNNMSITSSEIIAEAYNSEYEVLDIEFDINEEIIVEEDELGLSLTNSPNPFDKSTDIIFMLSSDQDTKLSIRDINGRLVKVITSEGHIGRNVIPISNEDLSNEGVYYYTLESENNIITKRMIMLK